MIKKTIPGQAPKVPAAVDGRIMHADPQVEAILLCLKPGENIPFHKNPCDVLFAGFEGRAFLLSPSGELSIESGETIFVTADEERAWKNSAFETARIMVFKILR